MIRLLLLDLDDTLVHGGETLPHVPEALTALAQLQTPDGEPLVSCLLSDFPLADPPDDPDAIAAEFEDYLALLDGFGLTRFFEPVEERITLSTHAGVFKPDPRLFDLALERSGVGARREECLFVSEHRGHVEAARALDMQGLVFAEDPSEPADFHDWSRAPALIHHLVAPGEIAGLAPSLTAWLGSADGIEVTSVRPVGDHTLRGHARTWVPLEDEALGALRGAMVQVPIPIAIDLDERGGVAKVEPGRPDPESLAEATHFARRLLARGEIALEGEDRAGATFEVRADATGRRRLQRRSYD